MEYKVACTHAHQIIKKAHMLAQMLHLRSRSSALKNKLDLNINY
jgi:hypothetical protein